MSPSAHSLESSIRQYHRRAVLGVIGGSIAGCIGPNGPGLQSPTGQGPTGTTDTDGGTGGIETANWEQDPGERLFIGPDGSDDNDGTRTSPFASISPALSEIRDRKSGDGLPAGGIEIVYLEGNYQRESSINLTEAESGTPQTPIRITAADDETARLQGGTAIDPGAFEPITGEAANRLNDEEATEHVMQLDLAAQGVEHIAPPTGSNLLEPETGNSFTPTSGSQLIVNGEFMSLSRWPNDRRIFFDKPNYNQDGPGYSNQLPSQGSWTYENHPTEAPRVNSWANPEDAFVYGSFVVNWLVARVPIDSIDKRSNTLTVKPAPYHGFGWWEIQPSYYYVNILEEIDQPGEYYIDTEAEMLYFYPPEGLDLASAEIQLSTLADPIVSIEGAKHVQFSDLILEAGRSKGITINGGRDIECYGCSFQGLAGEGTTVRDPKRGTEGETGVQRIRLEACDFHYCRNGASLQGGDRVSLTKARNEILNCDFQHLGLPHDAAGRGVGIDRRAVDNRIAHSHFHDIPISAIWLDGNMAVAEYNRIHKASFGKEDNATIGSNGKGRVLAGGTVRNNLLYNIRPQTALHSVVMGYRADDHGSNWTVVDNIFMDVDQGIAIGGGQNNTVTNNLMLFCAEPLALDARGAPGGWQHDNICDSSDNPWMNELDRIPYTSGIWAETYPEYAQIYPNESGNELTPEGIPCGAPTENEVTTNVAFEGGEMTIEEQFQEYSTVENNMHARGDLGFEPSEQFTVSFTEDSPVNSEIDGWESMSLQDIGLQQDEDARTRQEEYDTAAAVNQFVSLAAQTDSDVALDSPATFQVSVTRYTGEELRYPDGGLEAESISFESSEASILTVSGDGEITPKKTGTASVDITVDVEGMGTKSRTIDIAVAESASSFVTPQNLEKFTNPGYAVKGFGDISGPPFVMTGVISSRYDLEGANYGTIYKSGGLKREGTVVGKMTKMGPTDQMGEPAMAGLYAQNDLTEPDGVGSAAIGVRRDGNIHFMWDSDGEAGQAKEGTAPGLDKERVVERERSIPVWLKLVKDGQDFTGYYREDGGEWQEVGSATVGAAATVQDIGIAAGGHTGYNSSGEVIFEVFQIAGAVNASYSG